MTAESASRGSWEDDGDSGNGRAEGIVSVLQPVQLICLVFIHIDSVTESQ